MKVLFDYDPVTQRDDYLRQSMEALDQNFPGQEAWVIKSDNVFYYRTTFDGVEYLIVVVRRYERDSRLYVSSARPVSHILKIELMPLQVHKSAFDECSEEESDEQAMKSALDETRVAHAEMILFAKKHGGTTTH